MFDLDDEDLPNGYRDADLEMRELEDSARQHEALRKAGHCTHGWTQGPPGPVSRPTAVWTCHHCKKEFASEEDLSASREEAESHL